MWEEIIKIWAEMNRIEMKKNKKNKTTTKAKNNEAKCQYFEMIGKIYKLTKPIKRKGEEIRINKTRGEN